MGLGDRVDGLLEALASDGELALGCLAQAGLVLIDGDTCSWSRDEPGGSFCAALSRRAP